MSRLPPPIHWIGTLEENPCRQTNKQTIKQARYNGFISFEMLLKAIPLVGRDS